MERRFRILTVFLVVISYGVSGSADENWTRFRGPNGSGQSHLKGLPTNWSEQDYEWTVELPGKGHSSPVIFGKSLFVTSSEDNGTRTLHCLNADTGQELWRDSIRLGQESLHLKNSYASGSPVCDADHVFVAFGDGQRTLVSAYTHRGERLWTQDLGTFASQHGFGVSPLLHDGKVIVTMDQRGPSHIAALDAETGKPLWKTPRKAATASYSTPMILTVNGQEQIIALSGAEGMAGLDPETGRQLWSSGALPERSVASPVLVNGLLLATCGTGGRGVEMVVVRPGVSGSQAVVGKRRQNMPYVPTPIMHEGYLFLWNDDGIVCCVDPKGDLSQNVWRERIGGNYSGSPVVVDGKLYCISEDGRVAVLDASPRFRNHGFSPLGDPSHSTPAVANGRMYLRGFRTLSSLKANTETAAGSDAE